MNRLQKYLIDRFLDCEQFESATEAALSGNNISVAMLPGSALSLFAAALARRLDRPICLLTTHPDRAEELFHDLEFFGLTDVFLFAEDETLPYEFEEPTVDILAHQIELLTRLVDTPPGGNSPGNPFFVVPLESAMRKCVSLSFTNHYIVHIQKDDAISIESTTRTLHDSGYNRVPIVETRGEIAVRGGILDVFPLDSEHPIRFDFFGDRVESIRYFDPSTQRSLKTRPGDRVVLPPAARNVLIRESLERGTPLVPFPSLLPDGTVFLLDEPERFEARAGEFQDLIRRQYDEQIRVGERPVAPESLFCTLDEIHRYLGDGATRIEHHLVETHDEPPSGWTKVSFRAGVYDAFKPNLDTFLGIIRDGLNAGYRVVIACDNDGQVQRFEELLEQRMIGSTAVLSTDREARAFQSDHEGEVVLTVGPLHSGFLLPEAGLLFLTDREVFGRYKRRQLYRKLHKGIPVASVSEFHRGDFVVHVDHGIGRFEGLRRQNLDGRERDLIELIYQDSDRLLVPVEKIGAVQKYSAVEGVIPTLDKLGGKRWINRRRKSQEAIEKMAEELLDLYARRSTVKGHPYSTDTVWQSEFEASFLYQETPDQTQAVEEVKRDMQRPVPSDRLVCGDVGYGKTEVAMRAAFKAVQEKKQVAVLVPTTVLAQQHYNTFRERFADYDVRIEMISRFKTPKQQREILKRLRLGEIDILIGTHRVLSKDVEFVDLGLLVVDEEHRFGVRQKEKIKQLRASVDVITLTATPIPRTLHMALSGLRDMSVINTPPADRIPIRTSVIHFEQDLVEAAILRELNRGGQVFFVHNRVYNIDVIARRLHEIVPQARIAIGHGQMNEHELERVMLDFVDRKSDILVSTTIIESGLDIPNVNTIVINRADAFGLAQLYQLRGRVGRSARQAYAYLIVPQGQPITDAAVRRLAAIQEFVELGAGFQIAMRDMEIRGTGNILGREQHGAMVAIGFELYCDLLQKAVRKLKGEQLETELTAEVKWRIDAYVPEAYVPLEAQRVGIYKRLAQVRTLRAVADIEDEMRDRYGRLPEPAQTLLELAALRIAASLCSVQRVVQSPGGMKLEVPGDARELLRPVERARRRVEGVESVQVRSDEAIQIGVRPVGDSPLSNLRVAAAFLRALAEMKKS